MNIIGAGMAGLIAANYFRKSNAVVHEAQDSLPHNHDALLRFKSKVVGEATGIPFREVFCRKAIMSDGTYVDQPNMWLCNTYSFKVTGRISNRSIWNLEPGARYIAPLDFIPRLASGIPLVFGQKCERKKLMEMANKGPVISTIPMPIMMDMFKWEDRPEFVSRPIWAISFDIAYPKMDVYQTIYYPDLDDQRYRASVTGRTMIIEMIMEPTKEVIGKIMKKTLMDFGVIPEMCNIDDETFKSRKQEYGKIVATDDDRRQRFIYWLSREHNIYSLGRFATWRNILLDDLVHDLGVIGRLINASTNPGYLQALAETRVKRG